jgi:hypothetical protein
MGCTYHAGYCGAIPDLVVAAHLRHVIAMFSAKREQQAGQP